MNPLRDTATSLRKEGKSYNEIQKLIGLSKSTLSLWLKDVPLSVEAQKRLESRVRQGVVNGFVARNKQQTVLAQERALSTRQQAKSEIHTLSDYELKLMGTALYWAEGYKRLHVRGGIERMSHTISFVNADPDMLCLFLLFLLKTVEIPREKIRLYMRLYPGMDEALCKRYWKRTMEIPENQFFKTTWLISRASSGKRPFNRLPHGTLQIEVCSTTDFHRIMGWIEGMKMAP